MACYKSNDQVPSDDEGNDKVDWEKWDTYKNATVFVIDNSPSMFHKTDDEGNCLFKMCLISCLKTLDRYVFKSYYSTLAITVLDAGEHEPIVEFNTNVLLSIEKLIDITKKSNEELKTLFCADKLNSQVYYEGIRSTIEIFRKYDRNMKMTKRHIALLTCEPKPKNCKKDDEEFEHAVERMKTFEIQFIVIPLLDNFDWELFYKDLINKSIIEKQGRDISIEEFSDIGYDAVEGLQPIVEYLTQSRKYIRRVVFHYLNSENWKDENLKDYFYVQVLWFVKERKIYRNCYLDPETMKECVKVNAQKDSDDEEEEGSAEASSSKLVNDEGFMISLKDYQATGFRLLKVTDKLSNAHYVWSRWFVVQEDEIDQVKPEEESQEGGNSGAQKVVHHFDYIWEYCKNNNKVLICTFTTTQRQRYHLVELKPDRFNGALCFFGQYLPSATCCKHIPNDLPRSKNLDISTATELVKKLTVKNPDKIFEIYDPEYEKKANSIKGLLFSSKDGKPWEPEELPEYWLPTEEIAERIGADLTARFQQEYMSQTFKRSSKSQSKSQSKASTSKRRPKK